MNLIASLVITAVALATLAGYSLLCSLPVYLLWNGCLVGAIAGVNSVTWLQAWGLSFLFGILFRSSTTK